MKRRTHTLIIGGGVIGICCAYFLARRGAKVTLLERGDLGAGASSGNAGTIAPGHPPINRPGRLREAFRLLFDRTSPLYIPPRLDPSLARWLWRFRQYCTASHVRATMQALAPLGHITRSLFDQLVAGEGLDCDYRSQGYHEVFRTESGLAAAQHEAALLRDHGYQPEVVSGTALRDREPALRPGTVGGVFHPEAATCDPHRFLLELAERCRKHGATLRTGVEVAEILTRAGRVTGVRTQGGETVEADDVVVATGAYSAHLLERLGWPLPIQAAKGYHRDRTIAAGGTPNLSIACVLAEHSVFCTPMDGFVRFAGTLEFSGVNHVLRRARLEQLTRAADLYLTGVGDGPSRSEWCGLRPCTPDGMPIVGPVPGCDGLYVASGHAMLGLTLGPVTGQLVAGMILDRQPSADIKALRVDRF